jgi:hypothetical protein
MRAVDQRSSDRQTAIMFSAKKTGFYPFLPRQKTPHDAPIWPKSVTLSTISSPSIDGL